MKFIYPFSLSTKLYQSSKNYAISNSLYDLQGCQDLPFVYFSNLRSCYTQLHIPTFISYMYHAFANSWVCLGCYFWLKCIPNAHVYFAWAGIYLSFRQLTLCALVPRRSRGLALCSSSVPVRAPHLLQSVEKSCLLI